MNSLGSSHINRSSHGEIEQHLNSSSKEKRNQTLWQSSFSAPFNNLKRVKKKALILSNYLVKKTIIF